MVSASAPASRTEIGVVYFAGVMQGLALVTFPAASAIFMRLTGSVSTARATERCSCLRWCWPFSGLAPKLARRWKLRRCCWYVARVIACGCAVWCLTVDSAVPRRRERDLAKRYRMGGLCRWPGQTYQAALD
jgi:hypothetical protein